MNTLKLRLKIRKYFYGYAGAGMATTILIGFLIFLVLYAVAYHWPIM
jgi:hypothetical protein